MFPYVGRGVGSTRRSRGGLPPPGDGQPVVDGNDGSRRRTSPASPFSGDPCTWPPPLAFPAQTPNTKVRQNGVGCHAHSVPSARCRLPSAAAPFPSCVPSDLRATDSQSTPRGRFGLPIGTVRLGDRPVTLPRSRSPASGPGSPVNLGLGFPSPGVGGLIDFGHALQIRVRVPLRRPQRGVAKQLLYRP